MLPLTLVWALFIQQGNSDTTKSFLYSFKVCKNRFSSSFEHECNIAYPAEELNPE